MNTITRNKLLWGIFFLLIGLMVFIVIHQFLGAAFVCVGLLLIDLYSDEKKDKNKKL